MTVMRDLIQQELEKCDREQLQQVFEFIEQLSLSQESVIARSRQKTELETTFNSGESYGNVACIMRKVIDRENQ